MGKKVELSKCAIAVWVVVTVIVIGKYTFKTH